MKGKFIINGKVFENHIMNEGIKKIGRILMDPAETNINLIKISVGTDPSDPDDRTKSALISEVGSKYDIGSYVINSVFPFDVEITTIIPADDISAGTFLKEFGVWLGPVGSENLFGRAVDDTGVEVIGGQDTTVKYDLAIV